MNTAYLEVNNKNLFDFSNTIGATKRFSPHRFNNVDGTTNDAIFGSVNTALSAIPVNGKWKHPDGETVTISQNTILDNPSILPDQPQLTYVANNVVSFTHAGVEAQGTISPDGKSIHWLVFDNGSSAPPSDHGYWYRIVTAPVLSGADVNMPTGSNAPVGSKPAGSPVVPQGGTTLPVATTSSPDANILAFQKWANATHSAGLKEDGLVGPETNQAFSTYNTEYTTYLAKQTPGTSTFLGMPNPWGYVILGGGILLFGTITFFAVKHFKGKAMPIKGKASPVITS